MSVQSAPEPPPSFDIAALSAGDPETFCVPPLVTIEGLMDKLVAELPESAVTTKFYKTPVSALVSGWTRLTPAIVMMSPLRNVLEPPSTVKLAPVCEAPLTR